MRRWGGRFGAAAVALAWAGGQALLRFRRDKAGRVTALSIGVQRLRDLRLAKVG